MQWFSRLALMALCLLAAAPAASDAHERLSRSTTEAEAPTYRAVGRLNIAGNRHCTATLISERLVLTAAHCLFNARTGRAARPHEMVFVAGQRGEAYAALRGVRAVATMPGYVFRRLPYVRHAEMDLALLQLDEPIRRAEAVPLRMGTWARGGTVSVVGFGHDRAFVASLREGCRPQRRTPALIVVDCPIVPGVSGAPVLRSGSNGPVVVGVVSAMIKGDSFAVTIAVTPAMINTLKSALFGDAI